MCADPKLRGQLLRELRSELREISRDRGRRKSEAGYGVAGIAPMARVLAVALVAGLAALTASIV